MSKTVLGIVAFLVIIAAGVGIYIVQFRQKAGDSDAARLTETTTPVSTNSASQATGDALDTVFFEEVKSPHFVSSYPNNNEFLKKTPAHVAINFNFDLASGSKIAVTSNGKDVTGGETTIGSDKLSMSVPLDANDEGNYEVSYTACWPDGSCHDGFFGFSVAFP